MNSTRRVIVAVTLAALVFSAAAGQRPREPKKLSADEILNTEVTDCYTHVAYEDEKWAEYLDQCVNIRKVSVRDLLSESFFGYDTPVGFVPAAFDGALDRRDFNPTGMSAREVLDSIVAADPRYRWSLEDGVINVLPAAGHPPLLDVRLAEFKGEATVCGLFGALRESPEVRRRAAELGFDTGQPSDDANGYIIMGGIPSTYEIHCRDCTVLEVLNEIARQTESTWMYRESNSGGKRDFWFSFISPTH